LPESTISTKISYLDGETGEQLHSEELGPKPSGLIGFAWKSIPQETLDQSKSVKIEAVIDTGNGPEQLSPSIFSKVISASVGTGPFAYWLRITKRCLVWHKTLFPLLIKELKLVF